MDTKKAAVDQKATAGKGSAKDTVREIPKPESSSEYEGAPNRKPKGNSYTEIKTETSSSSGE